MRKSIEQAQMPGKKSKKFDELKPLLVKGYRRCWMEL